MAASEEERRQRLQIYDLQTQCRYASRWFLALVSLGTLLLFELLREGFGVDPRKPNPFGVTPANVEHVRYALVASMIGYLWAWTYLRRQIRRTKRVLVALGASLPGPSAWVTPVVGFAGVIVGVVLSALLHHA